MLCFEKNHTYTSTVIFGVESRKSTAENSTTENLRRKRPIFVVENIFCRKLITLFKAPTKWLLKGGFWKDCNFERVFNFPPPDLMCPRMHACARKFFAHVLTVLKLNKIFRYIPLSWSTKPVLSSLIFSPGSTSLNVNTPNQIPSPPVFVVVFVVVVLLVSWLPFFYENRE